LVDGQGTIAPYFPKYVVSKEITMKASEVVLVAEQRWRAKNKAKRAALKVNRKPPMPVKDYGDPNSGPVIAFIELPRRQMLIDDDEENV